MKKSLIALALVCVMVFAFAATALADHSPQFYFDDFSGNAALQGRAFQAVFPTATINVDPAIINNGQFGGNGNNMHGNYSQTTAKCGACHSVHRAPTAGTSSYSTTEAVPAGTDPNTIHGFVVGGNGGAAGIGNGLAVTSSRYKETAWTAEATTQLLLKTTAARACLYCHVADSAYNPMYGGDMNLTWITGPDGYNWNDFYGHTTGCTGCHAVHGANCFTSSTDNTARFIMKYQSAKNVKTDWTPASAAIGLTTVVQPEVYAGATNSLYTSQANMRAGVVAAKPLAAGVTPKAAAITALCTMCHANYASDDTTVNASLTNLTVWQPGSWATANGSAFHTTGLGQAGIVYASGKPAFMMMAYKNHPMKSADATFNGAGASASVLGLIKVANKDSWTCQSCHDAPEGEAAGAKVSGVIGNTPFGARQIVPGFAGYSIQVFPHYNPGYYKFMTAQNQGALDTPTSYAGVAAGKTVFYNTIQGADGLYRAGRPAIMNDGYCTKCHDGVGQNDGWNGAGSVGY